MRVRKAVITAAGKNQGALPMQTLFHQEGTERSVLSLIVREAIRAGVVIIEPDGAGRPPGSLCARLQCQ